MPSVKSRNPRANAPQDKKYDEIEDLPLVNHSSTENMPPDRQIDDIFANEQCYVLGYN